MSIWLCEDTADIRSDTINRYSFTEECVRGNFREKETDYDLMTVAVLRFGSMGENSEDNAIRLLSKMFSTDLSYEDKLDALQNEFKISVSSEMSREVQSICNLSVGVYNKGYGSGISAGKMEQAKETAYELRDMGLSDEKIARAVKVSMDTLQTWLAERESRL